MTLNTPPHEVTLVSRPTEGLAIGALITGLLFWPAGIILSPIALSKIKKTGNGGKGLAIAGLILSILGLVGTVIAIIAFVIASAVVVGAASSVSDSIDDIGAVDQSVAVGETGTTAGGIAFTVSAVTCGIPQVGDEYLNVVAQGQFCEVDVTVANNGTEPHMFNSSDAAGFIGDVEYASDGSASIYADDADAFLTDINPGNSIAAKVFFDIPVGAALDRLTFAESFVDGVVEVTL